MKIINILYVFLLINLTIISYIFSMEESTKEQQVEQANPIELIDLLLRATHSTEYSLPLELIEMIIVPIIGPSILLPKNSKALIKAIKANDIDAVKNLLKKRYIDVNIQNKYHDTALMLAVKNNNSEIVQILLDNGANPNIQNNNGKTPLMLVAINNKSEIAQVLLDKDADPDTQDNNGYTALDMALMHKNQAIINLIIKTKEKSNSIVANTGTSGS